MSKSLISFITLLSIIVTPTVLNAQQLNEKTKITKSISYQQTQQPSEEERAVLIKLKESNVISEHLQKALTNQSKSASRHESHDFSLYNVTTELIHDDDLDGFYHRFAVTVDADTLYNHATVYADFYLSYEGGPWIYYATSDYYDIHSDSFNDAFTIETELADGYPTGYYDLKIKLYDADTHDYLLTYDHYNDGSLTAIPLEDRYRDDYDYYHTETEVIITHGTGTLSLPVLIILFVMAIAIRLKTIFNVSKR